jgi:hypothetical protein
LVSTAFHFERPNESEELRMVTPATQATTRLTGAEEINTDRRP